MWVRYAADIRPSEITPQRDYLNRRRFLALGAGSILAPWLAPDAAAAPISGYTPNTMTVMEKVTDKASVTSYNNFYELGFDKEDPARYASQFPPVKPWSIEVSGACDRPGTYGLEDLIKGASLEERIYRMRCVEAWSMVIPWIGVPARDLLARFAPTSNAKYVEFVSIYAPEQLRGQRGRSIPWPYLEALRIDEAMHPLTLLAVGLYGEELPVQNGAPIRLVVPWKYGFKGGKSIVKIRFTETQPRNTWAVLQPAEYGFYANVNPEVDHPRWSQGSERRIGEFRRRPTLPFNGYADQVAGLYAGMDLRKNY